MNAVIVDVRKHTAVALKADGTFARIKMPGCVIGQSVHLPTVGAGRLRLLRRAAVAAAVLLVSVTGVTAANMPVSYVTLDVNPSIKYTLNVFNGVLDAEAVDQDGEAIVTALTQSGIHYRAIGDVIDMTISACRDSGYMYADALDYVVLSVASALNTKTTSIADQLTRDTSGDALLAVKVVTTTTEEIKTAAQRGTTPGKLEIIEEMATTTDSAVDTSAMIQKPVREIMKAQASPTASPSPSAHGAVPASGSGSSSAGKSSAAPSQGNRQKEEARTDSSDAAQPNETPAPSPLPPAPSSVATASSPVVLPSAQSTLPPPKPDGVPLPSVTAHGAPSTSNGQQDERRGDEKQSGQNRTN